MKGEPPNGMESHRSLYRGTCDTCNRAVTAELEVTDPAGSHQGVIPPPGIPVSCPSGHAMVLSYQGKVKSA